MVTTAQESPAPYLGVLKSGLDDQRVRATQVRTLYRAMRSATVADVALAIAVTGFYYYSTHRISVLVWFALHFLQTLRLPLLLAYFKDPDADARTDHWERVATRELGINSVVWGLAPWLMLKAETPGLTALMIVAILTMSSAGTRAVASIRKAYFAYTVPMTVGLASALAWQGTSFSVFLAIGCLLMLRTTLQFAMNQHDTLSQSVQLRYQQQDLSERLAEQMAATARASEEKTRFFAAASHDLRQPMHAIALFGAVLERELRDRPQHEHAERLMNAVRSLSTSLDTMLDVSQLDAGIIHADLRPTSLTPVFQSLQQVFSARAEEKGLQLRFRVTPLTVLTDAELLRRLLANLIENAIKYTADGGVLVVVRPRGNEAWIEVHDTGCGIDAVNLTRIFDEYYQVGNPGRNRALGLGIGLSIVRRLGVLLGHRIEVASQPGRGSRFRVVMPTVTSSTAETGPQDEEADERSSRPLLPRRVLLVDDEVDIGHAVAALLQSRGVEIDVVVDEASARERLHRGIEEGEPIDVLICDYRLANDVDGLELGQRLLAGLDRPIPMILVTGETAPQRLRRVRESGVRVIFKPASAHVLLQSLADLHTQPSVQTTDRVGQTVADADTSARVESG